MYLQIDNGIKKYASFSASYSKNTCKYYESIRNKYTCNNIKKNMYILRGYIYNYMCKFVNQYLIKDKKNK